MPLLLQTFQFLYTLTDPTAGPPDFSIRPLIAQYLKDTPLPNFAGAQLDAPRRPSTEETVYGEKPDKIASDGEDEGRGASEVGELLMHMSLADDGQVSCCLKHVPGIYVDPGQC